MPNHTYKRMEKPCSMDPRHEDKDLDHEEEAVLHSVSASVIAKTDQVRIMSCMEVTKPDNVKTMRRA